MEKYLEAIENCEHYINEFDIWFAQIKEDLNKKDEIIDKNIDGFTFISDLYGK